MKVIVYCVVLSVHQLQADVTFPNSYFYVWKTFSVNKTFNITKHVYRKIEHAHYQGQCHVSRWSSGKGLYISSTRGQLIIHETIHICIIYLRRKAESLTSSTDKASYCSPNSRKCELQFLRCVVNPKNLKRRQFIWCFGFTPWNYEHGYNKNYSLHVLMV